MIYIDASRYNNTAQRTGVENYSVNLIDELLKKHADEIALITPQKIDLPVNQKVIPFPRLWTHIRLSTFILKNRLPNLFVPSHVLPVICPKKSIITIHDVAFKRFPESYAKRSRQYLDWAAKFAAKKASAILTPSVATQQDLMDFYGIEEKRIHITPLGMSPRVEINKKKTQKIIGNWKLEIGNYFLYLGRLEHKKNTDTLLKAFAQFSEKHPDVPLVLAGFLGRGGQQIVEKMPKSVRNKVVRTDYISEEEKEALMTHALAFIFPSRYEGFGLPILEAMQHNLPIIASNIPSSREILRDNGMFFEVEDSHQLAQQMQALVKHPQKRQLFTKAYPQILEDYSWEKCAEKTWKILSGS